MIGAPAAALTANGRVISANPLFEAMTPQALTDTPSGLRLRDANANRCLAETLRRIDLGLGSGRSIPVCAQDGRAPFILHVLPIKGAARDLFSRTTALVVGAMPGRAKVLGGDLIKAYSTCRPLRRGSPGPSPRGRTSSRRLRNSAFQ
jgi:hypothetical protein